MAIEQLIYGAVPCGIDNGEMGGRQVFTKTKGMNNVNENIVKNLTASYRAPYICDYQDWLDTERCKLSAMSSSKANLKANQLANHASEMAGQLQPKLFNFKSVDDNGKKRFAMVFGKDMGVDWTGGRPFASFYNLVICDNEDIMIYPIELCSSKVVCCDMPRRAFYPDSGRKISTPDYLGYISSFAEDSHIIWEHSAGFDKITESAVIDFIKEGERLDILKSMLSALIQHKSGKENCRIVIADKKESIPLWIAAISFAFPLKFALDISFSTYEYRIDDDSYDINGVYVPELNGRDVSSYAEGINMEVTDYKCDRTLTSKFAVYDFKEHYFAPNVGVYDNQFMRIVENSFTMNMQIINEYKRFVTEHTTLKDINTAYMDAAVLQRFMKIGSQVNAAQMKTALDFAKSYASAEEKKLILQKLLSEYKKYLSNEAMSDEMIAYVGFCVKAGFISQQYVESVFMKDTEESFLDYVHCSFEDFTHTMKIAEKFCGFSNNQVDIAFVKRISLERLYSVIEELAAHNEKNRLCYIHCAVCCYIDCLNESTFARESIEGKIARKILEIFVIGETPSDEKRLWILIDKTNEYITANISERFLYMDIAYRMLEKKSLQTLSEKIKGYVAESYIESDESNRTYL